jgi:hypothetical protein
MSIISKFAQTNQNVYVPDNTHVAPKQKHFCGVTKNHLATLDGKNWVWHVDSVKIDVYQARQTLIGTGSYHPKFNNVIYVSADKVVDGINAVINYQARQDHKKVAFYANSLNVIKSTPAPSAIVDLTQSKHWADFASITDVNSLNAKVYVSILTDVAKKSGATTAIINNTTLSDKLTQSLKNIGISVQ